MLLRRVMKHVEAQNWLAVFLDFLIVVSGVIVAFQLQTWGEGRAAQQRAQQSLHQLYEESEVILGQWVQYVKRNDQTLELQDRAIAALNAGDQGDLEDRDLVGALHSMGHFPTISPTRRVYDELRSAGLIREIDAPEALTSVSVYYENLEFIQGQIVFFRPPNDGFGPQDSSGINYIYDPTEGTRRRIDIDFKVLAADPHYLANVVDLLRNRIVFQVYRRNTMISAAEMCIALANAIGETCKGLEQYNEVKGLPEWLIRDVPRNTSGN